MEYVLIYIAFLLLLLLLKLNTIQGALDYHREVLIKISKELKLDLPQ